MVSLTHPEAKTEFNYVLDNVHERDESSFLKPSFAHEGVHNNFYFISLPDDFIECLAYEDNNISRSF